MEIKELYKNSYLNKNVCVHGWIRSHRRQSHFGFIDLTDGTCFKTIQVVYDEELDNFNLINKLFDKSTLSGSI